jgi:iron complex outermembrane receptor protein
MKGFVFLLILILIGVGFAYGSTVKGIVKNSDTGDPLIGANVVIKGTGMGATTDEDGFFIVQNVSEGDYKLEVSYVGYNSYTESIKVGTSEVELQISLKPTIYMGAEITVLADRALPRETPVAFSDVNKKEMQTRLGSRDIPLVLNTTPSVYATTNGGGAGDARINIRGFNQRNVAVMINGIPINDMENGWVYWSNWDGLGDATNSLQVQRGLSAVNLATPSIGGTLNIITDPTAQSPGVMFRQEVGNDGFLKETLVANSGLINDKYAVSGSFVRKVGDGLVDKTWTDAWAYYVGASWVVNKDNRLELYVMGAPQQHGQNRYKQNIAAYDSSFAKDLADYDNIAVKYFPQDSAGLKYNENWNTVNPNYQSKQFWNGKEHDRYANNYINESVNYYHKPLANLNWYSKFTDKLDIFSTVYYSGGKGGGSGTLGSMRWVYPQIPPAIPTPPPSRIVDWNATYARNIAADTSRGILRNSVNNQWTIGAIAKANYKFTETFNGTFGVDWRTAEIEHFREVRDLLGGNYYFAEDEEASDLWTGTEQLRGLGDKVDYYNTNTVDWLGFYGQGEVKTGPSTAYVMGGYSMIKYSYTDHFKHINGEELFLETDWINGFQVKGGASHQLSPVVDVYANAGYVSKVPIFDEVISDVDGTKAENPKNEKFTAVEGGANYRAMGGRLVFKGDFYYTVWKDRTRSINVQKPDGDEALIFISGMDTRHMGLEFEGSYQPNRYFRFDGMASFGNWKYTNDVSGVYKDYSISAVDTTYNFYVKDLKSGDAPQTQFALAGTVFPIRGLLAQIVYKYYAQNYADWDPFSRTIVGDRAQSWKAPSYGVADIHASYDLPFDLKGAKLMLFAHIFNVFDTKFISDAVDNSTYNAYRVDGDPDNPIVNPHKADAAEVYFGLERTFNLGLAISL